MLTIYQSEECGLHHNLCVDIIFLRIVGGAAASALFVICLTFFIVASFPLSFRLLGGGLRLILISFGCDNQSRFSFLHLSGDTVGLLV